MRRVLTRYSSGCRNRGRSRGIAGNGRSNQSCKCRWIDQRVTFYIDDVGDRYSLRTNDPSSGATQLLHRWNRHRTCRYHCDCEELCGSSNEHEWHEWRTGLDHRRCQCCGHERCEYGRDCGPLLRVVEHDNNQHGGRRPGGRTGERRRSHRFERLPRSRNLHVHFTATAGGATCATSATYTITVARCCLHDSRRGGIRTEHVHLRHQLQPVEQPDIDVIDGSGLTEAPVISSSSPGIGFSCTPTTDPTIYDHECILQAGPGPSNGDDSGVVGANGTANTLVMEDSNNAATSNPYTVNVYNPPICAVAPDGTGSLSGTIDTTYTTAGGPTDAEACYDGANGPASTLLTGISASGGTIFTGSNPVDAGGGLSLTIMAGPGFNWTGSAGSGEADVDTGTAGLNKQTWSGGTTAAPPPSTLGSASTVASEASFKSSGDPLNTCPPLPAMIDAGAPFCFEDFEYSGAGPSAGQAALEYSGQSTPTTETPTVASAPVPHPSVRPSASLTRAVRAPPLSGRGPRTSSMGRTTAGMAEPATRLPSA